MISNNPLIKRLFSPRTFFVGLLCAFFSLADLSAASFDDLPQEISTLSLQESNHIGVEEDVLKTLLSLHRLQVNLKNDIARIQTQIEQSSASKRGYLQKNIDGLNKELTESQQQFARVALGSDIPIVPADVEKKFDLQQSIEQIFEPLFKELKASTKELRKKSNLRETMSNSSERIPHIERALINLRYLQSLESGQSLASDLEELHDGWQRELRKLESSRHAAELELNLLEQQSEDFAESSERFFKEFYKKRGLYLLEALISIILLLVLARLLNGVIVRVLPGYRKQPRGMLIRLYELSYRFMIMIGLVLAPLAVFYFEEDWVLFSLMLLILIGMAWGIRKVVASFWKQAVLLLNVGSVREGERLIYNGLPWLVSEINFYSRLENPTTGFALRLPILELIGQISRPLQESEPWFPCRQGDWVLLNDSTHAEVTGLSQEWVELSERGGTLKSYPIQQFLDRAPRNISNGFRLRIDFGLAYQYQSEISEKIPQQLHRYLLQRLEAAELEHLLLELQVEFQKIEESRLNLWVLANFSGVAAPRYHQLYRLFSGWCLEAAQVHQWQIPLPQLELHQNVTS